MVYCGRPSRGCDMCRVRKIRCDGARPTCSQCWVATRACPGYRDQPSLMVRNETAKVIQKVRGSGPISHKSIHEQKQWPSPALSQNTSKNPSPFVAIADDRIFHATCFFFRNYASLVVSRLGECHFRLGFFSDTCSGERALKASITSLGLANLGNIYTSPDLLRYARKYYGLAVNEINAAIDDPIQAAQDTTLAAILCVSLYEIIILELPRSPHAWLSHVRGATALLELRGEDQFQRQVGLHLFHAVRNEVLVGCLQRGEILPETLTKFPDHILAAMRTDALTDYDNILVEVMARICSLQAAIGSGHLQEADEIVPIAQSIDSQLLSFACKLFSRIPYKVQKWRGNISSIRQDGIHISHYERNFHVYTSSDACNIWNKYRCARIFVNKIIFKHLCHWNRQALQPTDHESFEKQRESCQSLLRRLAIDICLSIPFRLGLTGEGTESCTHSQMIGSGAGFALLSPLYLAASVDGYPGSVCLWVMTCFNFLGRIMGIKAALILLGKLPKATSLMK